MARVPFTDVEAWMEAHELRPADAARAFGSVPGMTAAEAADAAAESRVDPRFGD